MPQSTQKADASPCEANNTLVPTRKGEAPLLAAQRVR